MWKKIRNIHLSNPFFDYLINIQIFTLFHIHCTIHITLLFYCKFTLIGNKK